MKLIDAMKNGYKKRLDYMIRRELENEPEFYSHGGNGVLHFYFGKPEMRKRAEGVIRRTAEWFDECPYVNDNGVRRSPQGECDFAANRLIRVLYEGTEGLSEETVDLIKKFFLENNFESHYKSENHLLIFHVCRYLAAHIYKNDVFKAYGKTGAELIDEDRENIIEFIQYRGRESWGEFNSVGYMAEDYGALLTLYDYTADEKLKTAARMGLEQILLEMIANEKEGMYCGAHGRIYENAVLDYANGAMFAFYGLYFGSPYYYETSISFSNVASDVALTKFMPSDYVFAAAAEKPVNYENYEAKHLHAITTKPDVGPMEKLPYEKGHISKYTYITERYAMGSVCMQDEYENPLAAWYAHHQQHEWELTFPHSTEARIFTHHPGAFGTEGAEHGYWTGDLGCCCGTFYSNKNKALVMYDIPENKEQEINANVLFELYDVVEDGKYIFLQYEKNTYASLFFSEGYYHKKGKYENRELRSAGSKHGVVCVVGTDEEYGSFESFMKAVKAKVVFFDKENMILAYDNIAIDKKTRMLDGKKVEFPYPLYKNPFMNSELGSGIVRVKTSLGETVLDFNNTEIR